MLFSGMQIYVQDDLPPYRLAEDVPVTEEFRKEFNEWAAKFFSPKAVIPDGHINVSQEKVYMNPRTYARFKAANSVQRAMMQMEARYGSGKLY